MKGAVIGAVFGVKGGKLVVCYSYHLMKLWKKRILIKGRREE
jgi:hypothetical protein